MDARELEEIDRFLRDVGKPDLYAYYELGPLSGPSDVDAALRKRRAWAQGQQANPKHRTEALFLIKQNGLLRRALLDEAAAYRQHTRRDEPPFAIPDADVYALPDTTDPTEEVPLPTRSRPPEPLGPDPDAWQSIDRTVVADPSVSQALSRLRAGEDPSLPYVPEPTDVSGVRPGVLVDRSARARPEPLRPEPVRPEPRSAEPGRAPRTPPDVADGRVRRPEPSRRRDGPADPGSLARSLPPAAPLSPTPRLVVQSQTRVSLEVSDRPVHYRFVIRNSGSGRMPGQVTADRPWIRVPIPYLEADAPEHTREILVDPKDIPTQTAQGTVTIQTEHGEKHSFAVMVVKRKTSWWLPVAAGVAVVGALGGALWWNTHASHAAQATLDVTVDPPATGVFLGGREIGSGAALRVSLPAEQKVHLLVRSAGYAPYDEDLLGKPGEVLRRDIKLHPEQYAAWTPPDGPATQLGPEAEAVVNAQLTTLAACYPDGHEPAIVQFTYTVYVGPDGQVRDLSLQNANYTTPPAATCVREVFNAMRFPPFSGAYGVLSRPLSLPMPERKGR